VALADLPVVEVVRRRDLDATGAEGHVDVGVRNHGDRASREWQRDLPADKVRVAGVLRIDRDCDVAQHGFRSSGCHDDVGEPGVSRAGERVPDLPDRALFLLVVDFEVGHRGAECGIPVDEPLSPVDEPVVVKPDEGFQHRGRQAFVHRESLARPVARRAEPPHLVRDRRAGFVLPLPHPLDEARAAEIVPRQSFGLELVLDDDLRRDARVVGTELPERVVAEHPVPAGEDIHQRQLERVPHMQRAGDVGRRKLDAERSRARNVGGAEIAARLPDRVPLRLDGVGFEAFREFHGGACRQPEFRAGKNVKL